MSCAVFASRSMLYYRRAYYSDKLYNAFLSQVSQLAKVHSFFCHFSPWYLKIIDIKFIFIVQLLFQKIITAPPWTSTHLDFSDCFVREFIWEILSALPIPLSEISKTIPSLEDAVVDCNKKSIEYLLHIKYWYLPKYVYLNFFLLCGAVYFKH